MEMSKHKRFFVWISTISNIDTCFPLQARESVARGKLRSTNAGDDTSALDLRQEQSLEKLWTTFHDLV